MPQYAGNQNIANNPYGSQGGFPQGMSNQSGLRDSGNNGNNNYNAFTGQSNPMPSIPNQQPFQGVVPPYMPNPYAYQGGNLPQNFYNPYVSQGANIINNAPIPQPGPYIAPNSPVVSPQTHPATPIQIPKKNIKDIPADEFQIQEYYMKSMVTSRADTMTAQGRYNLGGIVSHVNSGAAGLNVAWLAGKDIPQMGYFIQRSC